MLVNMQIDHHGETFEVAKADHREVQGPQFVEQDPKCNRLC